MTIDKTNTKKVAKKASKSVKRPLHVDTPFFQYLRGLSDAHEGIEIAPVLALHSIVRDKNADLGFSHHLESYLKKFEGIHPAIYRKDVKNALENYKVLEVDKNEINDGLYFYAFDVEILVFERFAGLHFISLRGGLNEVIEQLFTNTKNPLDDERDFLTVLIYTLHLDAAYNVGDFSISDMWAFVRASNIFNPTFAHFHVDNVLTNASTKIRANWSEWMRRMYQEEIRHVNHITLDDDDLLLNTINARSSEFKVFRATLLSSSIYDERFLHFYTEFARALGLTKRELISLLVDRILNENRGGRSLIVEKLCKLGFAGELKFVDIYDI